MRLGERCKGHVKRRKVEWTGHWWMQSAGSGARRKKTRLEYEKSIWAVYYFFLWCNKGSVSFWWVFAGATPPWLREDDDDEEGASADNHVIGPSFDAFKKHGKFTRYPWSLCSLVESQVLWPVCHLILSSPLKSEKRLSRVNLADFCATHFGSSPLRVSTVANMVTNM